MDTLVTITLDDTIVGGCPLPPATIEQTGMSFNQRLKWLEQNDPKAYDAWQHSWSPRR